MEEVRQKVEDAVDDLFNVKIEVALNRPAEQFGDYATNIALQLATQLNKKPGEIAEAIAAKLKDQFPKVEVASPGFINITLSDSELWKLAEAAPENIYKNQTIVIEHTDPNPFKEFHIGHAYSNTIGEALKRLFEVGGAATHQVSYHGDVGLHIAMAIWGIKKQVTGERLEVSDLKEEDRRKFLGKSYALGANHFKEDDKAAEEIREINKHIYDRDDDEINKLYDLGRKWSFDYFEDIYKTLNVSFEKQYYESETGHSGAKVVAENKDKVFKESDGAVVFEGDEEKGLHTRVFITSQGLPTYEAKELGLALAKQKDYPKANLFVVVTANEINEYFKVLIAALGEIDKELANKIRHISHGLVKLPSGKMSSRTGEVITLMQVIEMLEAAVKKLAKENPESINDNVLGALKYTFLKHRVGGDIIFDIEESISVEGNSGPYLQYALVRANSILSKAKAVTSNLSPLTSFEPEERSLLRKLSEYPEVVKSAAQELMPSHVCTYLYELAQTFNRFYEQNRVIGDERESIRIALVKKYTDTLKNGLMLLNIPTPEKM